MKSVVTAAWFLNNAFGNLIVIICTELKLFETQMAEFFFYATIMLISILFYIYLAYKFVRERQLRQCNNNDFNQNNEDSPLINKMQNDNNSYNCKQNYYSDNPEKISYSNLEKDTNKSYKSPNNSIKSKSIYNSRKDYKISSLT